jgi:DNA replicative helicase MCM subunit Mcm2 (Cdc46/Mcm family)
MTNDTGKTILHTYNSFKKEQNINKVLETDFFKKESLTNQILILCAEQGMLTQQEVPMQLEKWCYLVTSVTSVTSEVSPPSSFLQGNTGNKGNRVTTVSSLKGTLKVLFNRLVERKLLLVDKSGDHYVYSLSTEGDSLVLSLLKNWLETTEKQELRNRTQTNTLKMYYAFDDYINKNIDQTVYNYNHKKQFVTIDLAELAKIDPYVVEFTIENPIQAMEIAKVVLKEFIERFSLTGEPNITFSGAPKDCRRKITQIRSVDLDKLISVMGEIRSRGNSNIQITSINYECPACGITSNLIQSTQKPISPSKCGSCGYKGKFNELNYQKEDFLRLTIYDLYENISSNEVPEELNIFLQKDLYGFSFLKEGDKVELTGISTIDEKTDSRGNKLLFQPKIFRAYGLKKLDKDFTDSFITANDEKEIEIIKQNPLEYHANLLFSDLHDVDFQTKLATICLYGDHNLLFVGKPGCGKTEISTRITKISLKGKFANCSTSSSSGILGSVTKNEFTGKYTLDGGVFRPIHPGGHCVLDEINRDNEKDIQKCILGIMNDKRININKANTRIDEPCEVSVWCNANPIKLSTHAKAYQMFGLLEPLYDRFDFVCYFSNELDWKDKGLVERLLKDKKDFFNDNPEQFILLRKYLLKAQTIDVQLQESDFAKLSKMMDAVLSQFDEKLSYRRLKTVTNLLKSICRLHLRDHTIDSDYQMISDIFLQLKNEKDMFYSKYVHGEEDY